MARSKGSELRLVARVLRGGEIAFGPGRAELLESIAETGSIVQAARRMSMSYMRAWTLCKSTNSAFKQPLVRVSHGGRSGGGAELTEAGRRALRLYRALERSAERATRANGTRLRRMLSP